MIRKSVLLDWCLDLSERLSGLTRDTESVVRKIAKRDKEYSAELESLKQRVLELEKANICSDPDRLERAIADVTKATPRKRKVKVE